MTNNNIYRFFIATWAVLFVFFHLYTAAFGVFIAQLQRPLHLTFAAVFGFLVLPILKNKSISISNLILALIGLICFGYNVFVYHEITMRQILIDPLSTFEYTFGAISLVLVLELTRRAVGGALVYVSAVFLLFAFVGPYLPGVLAHRGFPLTDVVDYMCFGLDGVYGLPLGISATYVFLFIILGVFMEFTGVGNLIMDLGKLLVGRYRGGAAKIAAISSAMVGSISGSAVANVYATGTITIPMMKKIGYKPTIAGAVEAVASTGGQIMPPVMGAAAFLMAEVLGVPYFKICKAAFIPAILYFTCLLLVLDYEAAKTGIKGLSENELPKWKDTISKIYLLLPIIALVVVLYLGYTALKAAFISILICFALSFFRKDTRFSWKTFIDAMIISAKRGVMIAAATAAAGIVIGIISLTGIGITFSSLVMSLSYGFMPLALIFIMIACIIMGMGTPTTVAYIVVVTLAAPAMMDFGFSPLSSHMFVFYFGVMSMITPPVEVAAYAAADISKGDPIKIGFTSCRIAILAFIMPYVFLFEPALLMEGSWWDILSTLFMTLIGVVILAGSITGWFFIRLNLLWRLILLCIFVLIFIPEVVTSLIGILLTISMTAYFYFKSVKYNNRRVQYNQP